MLSGSASDHDPGRTIHHYRTVETLREQLTLGRDTPKAADWIRQPECSRDRTDYSVPDSSIARPAPGCTLSLAEVHEVLDFTALP